jgi:kinetochore protein Mis12/MTW1
VLNTVQGLNFITTDDTPTKDSVTALRRKLQETQKLNLLLTSEATKKARLIEQLQSLISPTSVAKAESPEAASTSALAFIQNRGELTEKDKPLTTTTQFALSQLPALRKLIEDLRPRMKTMRKQGATSSGWRRERERYVESQTRRHLESTGLELGPMGEVRDGEWQGNGRRLGPGEVEALESVVGMVAEEAEADVDMMDETK